MHWNDFKKIVKSLEENYPEEDLDSLRLSELHELIVALHEFDDNPEMSDDKILEAILDIWIESKKN